MSKLPPLPITKRYVLRLFISLKHITANVIDGKTGRVAVPPLLRSRSRTGWIVGARATPRLLRRLEKCLPCGIKVDGLHREPIYANAAKEIEKKGFKSESKVWAIFNALLFHGVNFHVDSDERDPRQ